MYNLATFLLYLFWKWLLACGSQIYSFIDKKFVFDLCFLSKLQLCLSSWWYCSSLITFRKHGINSLLLPAFFFPKKLESLIFQLYLKNQMLETVITTCQQFLSYSNIFSNILRVTTAKKNRQSQNYYWVIYLRNFSFKLGFLTQQY